MVDFARTKPGTKRIAIISHSDEWGKSHLEPELARLKAAGLEVVETAYLERGQVDATSQVLRIKAAKPDFVLANLYPPELTAYLRDAYKYGVRTPVVTTQGVSIEDMVKRVGLPAATSELFVFYPLNTTLDAASFKPWIDLYSKYNPNDPVETLSFMGMTGALVIVQALKDANVDIVVCYLPVGSEAAAKFYAQCAIDAKVAFVNALPVFIAGTKEWADKFTAAGVPIVGDDIKSQVGATIVHRVLTRLFMDRGVRLDRTYQLNFGGNTDFLNMLERERLESKKISKTNAVTSILDEQLADEQVHVGPSDFVPWLLDRKWANIRLEGTTFGGVPLTAELKLEVWDSPNSAGVITDAIRCAKLGLDRKLAGTLVAPSSYFMKSPPMQLRDDVAHAAVEAFIRGEDNRVLDGTQVTKEGYPASESLNSVRA